MLNQKINQFFALSKKYFKIYFGISISLFLFVLFFQPFTTVLFEFENRLLFFAGFGLICLIFLFLIQILFQRFLIQNDYNIIDNSLISSVYYFSLVAATSLAFVFYLRFVGQIAVTFTIVIRVIVIFIGVSVVINIKKNIASTLNKYKKLLIENRSLQDKLKQFSESYANRYIELISENDSDNFKVQVSAVVYVKSADNYVEVGYLDGEEVKKKMIRNTLKNAEQQLKGFNNFIRTHRTSIVNIQNIEKLHKNFNTYWLSLVNTKETIPVSRQYLMAVKDLF